MTRWLYLIHEPSSLTVKLVKFAPVVVSHIKAFHTHLWRKVKYFYKVSTISWAYVVLDHLALICLPSLQVTHTHTLGGSQAATPAANPTVDQIQSLLSENLSSAGMTAWDSNYHRLSPSIRNPSDSGPLPSLNILQEGARIGPTRPPRLKTLFLSTQTQPTVN